MPGRLHEMEFRHYDGFSVRRGQPCYEKSCSHANGWKSADGSYRPCSPASPSSTPRIDYLYVEQKILKEHVLREVPLQLKNYPNHQKLSKN